MRRRSSYGAYLANGLWREGCGSLPSEQWCQDCIEIELDALCDPYGYGSQVGDTFRRVLMRHQMRMVVRTMPYAPRRWRKKR